MDTESPAGTHETYEAGIRSLELKLHLGDNYWILAGKDHWQGYLPSRSQFGMIAFGHAGRRARAGGGEAWRTRRRRLAPRYQHRRGHQHARSPLTRASGRR